MQRVKNPPIPLKDFASVESMREEINEVVAFLQNPRAFQEMGARAPRVCYYANNVCVCGCERVRVLYVLHYSSFLLKKKKKGLLKWV